MNDSAPFQQSLKRLHVIRQQAVVDHVLMVVDQFGERVVVRHELEFTGDGDSKPLLEAMRKAATQCTGTRHAFIAVQLNELQLQELLLPHVQRRATMLSHALFSHYS